MYWRDILNNPRSLFDTFNRCLPILVQEGGKGVPMLPRSLRPTGRYILVRRARWAGSWLFSPCCPKSMISVEILWYAAAPITFTIQIPYWCGW
jgi:hypothetical protein